LEKYALTKPLPPTKGTIKMEKLADAKEEETKARRRKEDGNINIKIKQN
jgi:hypothetical protein